MRADTEVDIVEGILLLDTDLSLNKLWLCVIDKNKNTGIDICLTKEQVILLESYCQKFLDARNEASPNYYKEY